MTKDLAIIVPVYNKELFLDDTMNSINNLDIDKSEIEVIFVDDVSTDQSLEKLKAYENEYDYVKVVELEENTVSPSTPRNVGIDVSDSKYITFLDADDWLDAEGFPKLLQQALDTQNDILFGQSLRHKDRSIRKIARFSSYETASDLVPYEIDKIFRAVGPPGKIIKASIIKENDIKFEHMKYGEDKLFFTEVIGKAHSAGMNDAVVYHVNRYGANQSLIGETDIFEKTACNLEVLKKLFELDIPETARRNAISRIIEMDYLSRLFINKRFLKSEEKQLFYDAFAEMETVLDRHHLNIKDYLTEDKYEKVYQLLSQSNKERVVKLIKILIKGERAPRYVSNGLVHFLLPEELREVAPLTEDFFAVYGGTEEADGQFYEVIHLYKKMAAQISRVQLVKLKDEAAAIDVGYQVRGGKLRIPTKELEDADFNFNIQITYNHYRPCIVNMNLPSVSKQPALKRQHFKVEFKDKRFKDEKNQTKFVDTTKYYDENPGMVFSAQRFKVYEDVEFQKEAAREIEVGELFTVEDIQYTEKGTPRLVLKDGSFVTANKKFVTTIDDRLTEQYLVKVPRSVKVLKKCKAYNDRNFKDEAGSNFEEGDIVNIVKIVFSSNGTPRLKTDKGVYMTANRDFVKSIT